MTLLALEVEPPPETGHSGDSSADSDVWGVLQFLPPAILVCIYVYSKLATLNEPKGKGKIDEQSPTPPTSTPDNSGDIVECSLFAPKRAERNSEILVQAFAHLLSAATSVRTAARRADPVAELLGRTTLTTQLQKGEALSFELTLSGSEVDFPFQETVWNGKQTGVQFLVKIGDVAADAITGRLVVSNNGMPVGRIAFRIPLADIRYGVTKEETAPRATGVATPFEKIFMSYASEDRAEVLARASMAEAMGKTVYMDIDKMRSGDIWEKALEQWVGQTDVMCLFWSSSAQASDWVRKEWTWGLKHRGSDYILPVVIEGPPFPQPPEELKHLHFGDRYMHLRSGGKGAEKPSAD